MAQKNGSTTDTVTTTTNTHTESFGSEMKEKGVYCANVCEQKFMKKWAWAGSLIGIGVIAIGYALTDMTQNAKTSDFQVSAEKHLEANDRRLDAVERSYRIAEENGKKLDQILTALRINQPRRP